MQLRPIPDHVQFARGATEEALELSERRGADGSPPMTLGAGLRHTLSPTIDWAGAGLVTTAPELTSFVRGLWSWQILRCFDVGSDTFSREAGALADRLPPP